MEKASVLGYPVHTRAKEDLVWQIFDGLGQGQHQHVVTLNPEMIMRGEREPEFGQILKTADVVLPDGAGVVWALKRQGLAVERVPGIEFSERLMAHAAQYGEAIALIGAAPSVCEAAQDNLAKRFPGLQIVYAHHGFFKDAAEKDTVAEACALANPKYVFVALGVPAQEIWIRSYRNLFAHPTVFVGVGGSFDVWSGLKKRAHPFFLKFNLEWLYRITSEPFRIPRVYKVLPLFAWRVLRENRAV